jgi:hypothetical protein
VWRLADGGNKELRMGAQWSFHSSLKASPRVCSRKRDESYLKIDGFRAGIASLTEVSGNTSKSSQIHVLC